MHEFTLLTHGNLQDKGEGGGGRRDRGEKVGRRGTGKG